MAKFKLENRLGNGDPVWAFFNSYETFSKSDTKLVITSEWGSRIEYKGTGFEFNGS